MKNLYAMTQPSQVKDPYLGPVVEVQWADDVKRLALYVDPLEVDRVRWIPGARKTPHVNLWHLPCGLAQFAALSYNFSGRISMSKDVRLRYEYMTERAESVAGDKSGFVPEGIYMDGLRPFQRQAVKFMARAGNSILGDDMGTGKTIVAIAWMHRRSGERAERRHLVVCPNSIKYKWQSEINKWWPEAAVYVIDGTVAQRRKQLDAFNDVYEEEEYSRPRIAVINYEALRLHSRCEWYSGVNLTDKDRDVGELNLGRFNSVVLDEAQKISNPKAKQTLAAKALGKQANYRLAMTGTVLTNSPDDVWSIGSWVEPEEFGSRNQFRNTWCTMQTGWHGGFENQGFKPGVMPYFDKFWQSRFIRRTKAEVLTELPKKLPHEYRYLPFDGKQASEYKKLAKDMMTLLDGGMLVTQNPLDLMIRLKQAATAQLVLDENGDVSEMKGGNKRDAILDILDEAPGDPLVVFSESRLFVEMMEKDLRKKKYRVGVVSGAVSPEERAATVDLFQMGGLDVVLCTLGAGAEGITLTRANRIVMAQQSWSHATNAQAMDRVHRMGQEREVQVIILLSKGTVDEAVAAVDKDKEGRFQQLVRDPEWLVRAMKGQLHE